VKVGNHRTRKELRQSFHELQETARVPCLRSYRLGLLDASKGKVFLTFTISEDAMGPALWDAYR